ncbi:MAG TPA: FAD-dependent monooxygenase [Pyrinomonadaceae bacterium]|nr:FAD-dependent monooxygenase [Pyrinomonadaceae bacterium]
MVRIAIIGGGIGGLTTALALRQFGFESQVYEQAPALHDVGAAIAIWPNAMRVLDRLGLAAKILERSGLMKEIRWVDKNGWLINHVPIPDSVALHRADLQNTLLNDLPPESIHLGYQLIDQKQQGNRMIATFANGRSTDADFLIGADGIHSRVRAQFINDGDPIDRGYTIWRGISAIVPSAIPAATAVEFQGRGKRFGIGPVGLGRVGWWASANGVVNDDLARLFEGWYPLVLELIDSTPAASIIKNRALDRPSNKDWGRGRMTLLGDAIHPTTPNLGQGGCLAIEDAFVLAMCFKKYGASEDALRNYERSRYKRTTELAKYSRYYGAIGQWENIWPRALRRTALALAPEAILLRLMQIVFDYEEYTDYTK